MKADFSRLGVKKIICVTAKYVRCSARRKLLSLQCSSEHWLGYVSHLQPLWPAHTQRDSSLKPVPAKAGRLIVSAAMVRQAINTRFAH